MLIRYKLEYTKYVLFRLVLCMVSYIEFLILIGCITFVSVLVDKARIEVTFNNIFFLDIVGILIDLPMAHRKTTTQNNHLNARVFL